MIDPETAAEQMMYTTLIVKSANHSGTAFLLATQKNNIVVVSNRHFAEKSENPDYSKTTINDSVQTVIHLDDGNNITVSGNVDWYLHPTEDLAFFKFSQLLAQNVSLIQSRHVNYKTIPFSMIPSQTQLDELNMIEDVVMVGYPNGLYDKVNNYPLFRYGKTASHPCLDFNGTKRAMIDIPCLPGSSGSPVFILNESGYTDKKGNIHLKKRGIFLGIEVAMPQRINQSILELVKDSAGNVTGTRDTNFIVLDDMSLGYYIKSSELLAFIQVFTTLGI